MKIHAQRGSNDCGVSALASFFDLPYEDIYMAAVKLSPAFARKRDGLTIAAMLAIAKAAGRPLTRVYWRHVDLDEHTGVLGVNWNYPKKHGGAVGHWVVLRAGTIIDPSGPSHDNAWDYLAKQQGREGTLLKEAP